MALIALLPLAFVAVVTLLTGWDTVSALVFRQRVADLLVSTALLEICVAPLVVSLGVGLAWLIERTDLPGRRWWAWLCVAPLGVPAFVHGYAWVSVLPGLGGLGAAAAVSVLAYFPFLYLPVAAQLRRLDPSLEDVAASLGYSPWAIFFRVVIPQLNVAIWGGLLLVSLHLLAEYGLFAMIQFDTFTTAIVDQFQSAYNGVAANMLAGVLIVCCLFLLVADRMTQGSARYARVGTGSARILPVSRLGRMKWLAVLLPALAAAMSIGVPLLTLVRWTVLGGSAIWDWERISSALAQTVLFAGTGALVATAAAMPMAWLSVRVPGRFQRALEACHYYVGALPGVVIALALVTVTVRIALPLYQTMATVLIAYLLLFLPRALVGLRASLTQAPRELEDAAMALGHTPVRAMSKVTLRLAAPGVAAAMGLVGLGIANELTATLMLAPNGTRTLATEFWSLSSELDYSKAAPYALLMVLVSLPMTYLLHAQSKRASGR